MPNADIDKRDILLSTSRSGEIILNVGEVINGVGYGADVSMWGTAYFVSMPDVPSDGGAAQALVLVDGQTKRVIATRDNRAIAKVGTMVAGDSAQLSGGPGRVLIKKEGGVVSMYSEMEDGTSMVISIDPPNGQIFLGNGQSYIEIKDGEINISVGAHMISLTQDMIVAFGKTFQTATSATCLGFTPTSVPPAPSTNNVIVGASGAAGVMSPSVFAAGP